MANYEIPEHERERLFQKEVDDANARLAAERAALTSAKTRRELVELFAVNPSTHNDPISLAHAAYSFITEDLRK